MNALYVTYGASASRHLSAEITFFFSDAALAKNVCDAISKKGKVKKIAFGPGNLTLSPAVLASAIQDGRFIP
jgi:hypothetical protein